MFGAIKGLFTAAVSTDAFPEPLKANVSILSADELNLASILVGLGQTHLFEKWDLPGTHDKGKHDFFLQVEELNGSYGGGLSAYIENARELLKSAAAGDNPLEGWKPQVPRGVSLEPVTPEYERYEERGLLEVGTCGFVLVAGGLGERLGYNGIKVELPTQTITNVLYLEFYCKQILTMQGKYANSDEHLIPLAVMVSDDTATKTEELLEKHQYFGLQKAQVTLMKQGKVPALVNNNAEIAAVSPYVIDAKPHGHGDVHSLMHSTGTAAQWRAAGVKWLVFFQDTNSLAFITLPAILGVSVELGLEVNSLAIPRVAKQAVGAITKLVHADGREMTVNVEYNQLDPLLRANGSAGGDENDAKTGRSPYPGNINQLIFSMDPYVATLQKTSGAMPEFVNPKYADAEKMAFKKPTRLECMMQDYPKLLGPGAKVGFTTAPEWCCFSPCKNNSTDAAASAASGVPAGSAYTAESDQYFAYAELLRRMGANVPAAPKRSFLGIAACPGPCIVMSPESAIFPSDMQCVFPYPTKVSISARSTLVLQGEVVVTSLNLDGALKITAEKGTMVLVKAKKALRNGGFEMKELSKAELEGASEVQKMRGYVYVPKEVKEFTASAQAAAVTAKGEESASAESASPEGKSSVPAPSTTFSFAPIFSTMTGTSKADESDVAAAAAAAKVDEQDGVIDHLDQYSPAIAQNEDIDPDSITAHMRPLASLGSSAFNLGSMVIALPLDAVSRIVIARRQSVQQSQEFVCDGEQLVPIDEFEPEPEDDGVEEKAPSRGGSFFPTSLRAAAASLRAAPEPAVYAPPSATPLKATPPQAPAASAAPTATTAAAAESSVFPSFMGALMPSLVTSSTAVSSSADKATPASDSALATDSKELDFTSSSVGGGSEFVDGQKEPAECCVPTPACLGAPAGTKLPGASILDSPSRVIGKTLLPLGSTPTKELDKSISLLSSLAK